MNEILGFLPFFYLNFSEALEIPLIQMKFELRNSEASKP